MDEQPRDVYLANCRLMPARSGDDRLVFVGNDVPILDPPCFEWTKADAKAAIAAQEFGDFAKADRPE